jgi:hypothetical protein
MKKGVLLLNGSVYHSLMRQRSLTPTALTLWRSLCCFCRFAMMKKGALLLNVSRGGLVDSDEMMQVTCAAASVHGTCAEGGV